MDIDEFQTLATTLITVVGDRRLKRLKKLNKDGSLQGIFVNNKGEDTSVKVVYYPEHNMVIYKKRLLEKNIFYSVNL